jgi:hypothetical protein
MQIWALIIFLAHQLLIQSVHCTKGAINALDFSHYANKSHDVQKSCPLEAMHAYGLFGDVYSLGEPNRVCPSITANCCGPEDQRRMEEYWEKDRKIREAHNMLVLKIFRFILGYLKKWSTVATQIVKRVERNELRDPKGQFFQDDGEEISNRFNVKTTSFCYKQAKSLLESDIDSRKKVETFYADITSKVEFLDNARRGFYCMLCSADSKSDLRIHGRLRNGLFANGIIYSQEFCQDLVANVLPTVYVTWKSFQTHLSHLLKVLLCVSKKKSTAKQTGGIFTGSDNDNNSSFNTNYDVSSSNPLKSLPNSLKGIIKYPLGEINMSALEGCNTTPIGGLTFKLSCNAFCSSWKITEPTTLFDHDAHAMFRLYRHLLNYNFVLSRADQNMFRDDVVILKRTIESIYNEMPHETHFYRSWASDVNFSNFKSHFWPFDKGVHPLKLARGSSLTFAYKCSRLVSLGLLGFLLVQLLFQ